ncbi:MAG TPA: hypothetical protein VLM40_04475 [Gemmata sp.]|nr:hypothetical protein [Gemmata sp.]
MAHSAWAQDEVARAKQYAAGELEKLRRVRQALAEMESKAEAAIYAKNTELTRRESELAARQAELENLEAELTKRTEAIAAREAEAERFAVEFGKQEDAVFQLQRQRKDLEAEVADLGRMAAELGPQVERLQLRRDEATAAREQLEAKQSTLDRRLIEIGRTELALQQRRDELNQLEAELRAELETRECELERQRAALDEQMRAVRQVPVHPTPPPLPQLLPTRQTVSAREPADETIFE